MVSQKMTTIKWSLQKITTQLTFLNVQKKTFDPIKAINHSSSGDDVCSHQFKAIVLHQNDFYIEPFRELNSKTTTMNRPDSIVGSKRLNLSHLSRRYTRYLLTSHSEIVDIEYVAKTHSISKQLVESSTSSQAVIKSPTQYHCDIFQNIRVILMYSLAFKMRHSMRMLVKDSRSQDGIDDKDNDEGSKSRSQSMKEQAYNKEQRERPRPHELNDKSNLIDLMKECHQ
ncbi:hypothetical protein Tco_0795852 [Tanacetum coccineum]